MKRETWEYLSGIRNSVRDDFIVGREHTCNGEYIIISLPNSTEAIYALWNNKDLARKYFIDNDLKVKKRPCKGTGGKPAYIMLMDGSSDAVASLSVEIRGALLSLLYAVEWNSGKLIRRRDSKAMTRKMLSKYLGISMRKVKYILNELTKKGLICYNNSDKCYYISDKLARKGVKRQ